MKYSEIKDIEGIEAAQARLSSKLTSQGRKVTASYENFKEAVSPAGLFASGLHTLSSNSGIAYDKIALTILHILKRKLS